MGLLDIVFSLMALAVMLFLAWLVARPFLFVFGLWQFVNGAEAKFTGDTKLAVTLWAVAFGCWFGVWLIGLVRSPA